jgi:hypothetical protein
MSDIVERLRSEGALAGHYDAPAIQREAADEIDRLRAEIVLLEATGAEAAAEIERLRDACTKMNTEVCQRLGKALGYPWFKDDQKNFPGATEESGVCTGEHVAEIIAAEAADEIERLRAERDALRVALMPFAVAADPDLAPETDDKWVDTSNYMLRDLTYGYFRKARAALKETGHE